MTMELLCSHLSTMIHSPIQNYVVPGLISWKIGEPAADGSSVRLLVSSRNHQENVVPHSHRFDSTCLVLKGRVRQQIWNEDPDGDAFMRSQLIYGNAPGVYSKQPLDRDTFKMTEHRYAAGESYYMEATQIHSVFFERDTAVLFFEGPQTKCESVILEPVVNDKVIPTFTVQPWMFKR